MEHFIAPFQQAIGPVIAQLPGEITEHVPDHGLSQRSIWQNRTRRASAFIATGNLHLVILLVSWAIALFPILLRFLCRACRPKSRDNLKSTAVDGPSEILVHLPSAFAHLAAALAACCLSWLDLRHGGSWKRSLLLTYVVFLGVGYICCKNKGYRTHLYRHMNGVVVAALALAVVQDLVPMTIVEATYRPSSVGAGIVASLAAGVVIALGTPRPRRPLIRDAEIERSVKEENASPEETCSLFSYYCSYEWITYVIFRGCRRDLTMDDLPPLPSYDEPLRWLEKIKRQRRKGGKTFRTLCRLLKTEINTMMTWSAMTAVIDFMAPYSMLRLLAYLEDPDSAVFHPALWIALLFVGPITRSLCYQQYIFTSTRLVVRVNVSLVQELYQTAMRSYIYDGSVGEHHHHTKKKEKSQHGAGPKGTPESSQANLTSLMSYDVDAIYNSRDIFYLATAGPISITLALVFLYQMLGWPSLFGVLTLLCLSPLPALASRKVSRIQRSVMRATDARLSKISEYLNSIRTLKYFGWEHAAIDSINNVRRVEQRRLWWRSVYAALISMAGELLPLLSLLVMFSIYILFTGQPLRAPVAFTSLSIMETLRVLFVWLSNVSRYTAQGSESLRRIDNFLETAGEIKRHPEGPLELINATFKPSPVAAFRLQDVTIRFKPNSLNVVTGPTGSGKTTLLLSCLGETVLESGTAYCPQDVAYVPQAPWLQNDTIRQNIVFYSPFDETRYATVIEASGLTQDLRQLPAGDMTRVGEKGTSLSGGQKQRVSFARALYSSSSTLLLDDIFSALDTHTASLVYEKSFRSGLLKDRTVVLVTHYPAALQDAESIVRLEHGKLVPVQALPRTLTPVLASPSGCSTPGSETDLIPVGDEPVVEQPLNSADIPVPPVPPVAEQKTAQGRIVEETSSTGRVPRTLMFSYMRLFGSVGYAPLVILATISVQFAYFSITYWLSIWTGAYEEQEHVDTLFYLGIYAAAIFTFLFLQVCNNLIYQYGSWVAAKTMHQRLVTAVLSAPISWFDQNPIGRAINRFGNDTRSMDTILVEWLRMSIENALRFLLRIASVASIMPIFALPAAIICSAGFIMGEMYTRAQVSIKRLRSISYSPVFSHFTDSISGLSVIRARTGMDQVFQAMLAEKLAVHSRTAEAQYNCNRWVSVRSDFCAASVSAAAGCVAYFWSGSAGLVGFSLTNAIGLSQTILTLVRTMNELEIELNSFQRMKEYAEIEPEESLTKEEHHKALTTLPASWPTSGRVEFSNVTARYQPDGPDVLRGVSFVAHPGERIGIVGRTGSGKSTLGLSLLRFVDLVGGTITIDGVDISRILLNRLRTSVTLIPQEPVLFSGTVQSNLDPFGESSESELQSALSACTSSIHVPVSVPDHVHAPPASSTEEDIPSKPNRRPLTLDTPVAANGENFSQGQRQVLSLSRALCRRSKVVLLDEATASVDHETDMHMQQVLREMFSDCTIIAIAHRLRTIMDYDRVLVMAGGEIVENDSPRNLVAKQGVFWNMLRNTGEYEELVGMIGEGEGEGEGR
ncbi:putative ABC multidrug transporter [Aspergillus fijiensis CBS 313.89]|uniref:ABC multidrug transporter n=1 Tax=Aspergillus fijiensis CBS 313.89 TaxID=1448319 RepID=A0A8G1W0E8_9EURO|nr:ABC multidrug transporter [Aspergillus fijiensis CBS 313.89]RAK78513.1 ABC multidrug transporter [Aspergillus fijiensis CBS 313.89]